MSDIAELAGQLHIEDIERMASALAARSVTRSVLPDYLAARPFASINFNARPATMKPSAIVLHATVGDAQASLNWLANPKSGVSIHYLIDRDGTIYQMVAEELRAWHAGASSYRGLTDWNDFSIGIELVNRNDGNDPYDVPLVKACRQLCACLVAKYNIPAEMIVTHQMISGALTGKSDPIGFPLKEFIMAVTNELPLAIRAAAWAELGIANNPDAALQRKAKELGLGRPMSNEHYFDLNGVMWLFQLFDKGILATEAGNWGNIRVGDWL